MTSAEPTAIAATATLLATLRLASPALPIGGFSYSQGLESAIDRGWVRNEAQAGQWLDELLDLNVGRFDAPLQLTLAQAIRADQWQTAFDLHQWHLATRESAEQHAESLQMGYSLLKLLEGLEVTEGLGEGLGEGPDDAPATQQSARLRALAAMTTLDPAFTASLPWAWALAGRVFGLPPQTTLTANLWSWLENQVMVTLKAVPLGQQAGQRLMSRLLPRIAEVVAQAARLPRDAWSNQAPGFALAACWHETQYSRMFRS